MPVPYDVSSLSAAAAIAPAVWRTACPPDHPFLNADFFDILERHQTAGPAWGWQAAHRLAKAADGRVAGLLPTYVKSHSHGDFIHDWSWASAYRQLGKPYYPKLLSGLPHTPAGGRRLLGDDPLATAALIEALKRSVAEEGYSSWHVAFPDDRDCRLLAEYGLLVSHNVQFHWRNRGYADFTGYLAAFPSEKRRKVKAERRKVADSGLILAVRHGDEIEPGEWPPLHALYAATFDKYGNHAAFSADCFAELATRLGRRMVVFIAYQQGAPVAVSICFRSRDTLYGRYWGTSGNFHSLHFELCFYQGIDYCLHEGLGTFEPGAGGEHKVARGFEPTVVRSCHWIEDARMRQLIGDFLERNHAAVLAYAEEAANHLPFRRGEDDTQELLQK